MRMAQSNEWLKPLISKLVVSKRELTGAGSYTDFEPSSAAVEISDRHLDLNALISVPDVPNGMSAALFVKNGHVAFLELVVNGGDAWSGRYDGFIVHAQQAAGSARNGEAPLLAAQRRRWA
jgi:hypothetical protein